MDFQTDVVLWGTLFAATLSSVYVYSQARGDRFLFWLVPIFVAVYAVTHILFIVYLWLNHIAFPLNLEAMELTMLQHVKRVMNGQLIYVDPSPNFVPLIYNPLYYFLIVPFAWVFGPNLFTMRLVSILGMLGAGLVIFGVVRRHTASTWWGVVAVGLFSAAYRVMDTYLDNAHADSWMLFTTLLGCYLIDQSRSWIRNMIGVLLMVIAFWFKQYGAIFCLGALLYLTWREGWRKSVPYWLLAAILGPGLYLAVPPWLLGPRFHFFTWEVPRHWVQFDWNLTIVRVVKYIVKFYFWLAVSGLIATMAAWRRSCREISLWHFMLPIAVLSGFYVALDPGNNNNVFIPLGVWLIVTGVLSLKQLMDRILVIERWGVHIFALSASFVLFFYNPMSVIVSSQAPTAYRDLVHYLKCLDGPVYAPWFGQLQDGYEFYPAVHWVAMIDLYRDPSWNLNNHPITRRLLEPVLHPQGKAYILLQYPLGDDSALKFLAETYVLDTDFGERFASLATLPKLINLGYPRYLYRYLRQEASQQELVEHC